MRAERVLILGGTRDARKLASALLEQGFSVITSLAGVTEHPVLPEGEVRTGGFGGPQGLADYIAREGIALVADATHPFAAQISAHAHEACRATGVSLLRLERSAWEAPVGGAWSHVSSAGEAARSLPAGARAFLTIGRKEIAPFFGRSDVTGIARMIEPPATAVPPGWTLLLERPPFPREAEMELMRRHAISHLVTKNAGGAESAAKLEAARALPVHVIMIARPTKPPAQTYSSAEALAGAARRLLLP